MFGMSDWMKIFDNYSQAWSNEKQKLENLMNISITIIINIVIIKSGSI